MSSCLTEPIQTSARGERQNVEERKREKEKPTDERLKDEKNVIELRTTNEERETGREEPKTRN
jgi:hypothetical protein